MVHHRRYTRRLRNGVRRGSAGDGDRVVLTAQDRPQRWLILGNSAVIDALEKNLGDIR